MEKNNIFDGAYFGKVYKTRDGRKAVFLGIWKNTLNIHENPIYKLHIDDEEEPIDCEENGQLYGETYTQFDDGSVETYGTDIVSEWKEEINVEELVVNKMNIFDKILQLLISIKQIIVKQ